MKKKLYIVLGLVTISLISGCGSNTSDEKVSGIEEKNMDISIRPQDDFYTYTNGNWLKTKTIPADKAYYSAFSEVTEKTKKDLHTILDDIVNKSEFQRDSDEQKIFNLYSSYMDVDTIDKLDISPLNELINEISYINSYDDLTVMMAKLLIKRSTIPFTYYVWADDRNSQTNILYFLQDGLGLLNRDYYLNNDDTFTQIQQQYVDYIKDMIILTKFDGNAMLVAQDIYDLEYQLATISWSREDNMDVIKTYNKLSVNDLDNLVPNFNMKLFIETLGFKNVSNLIVSQPSYFEEFNLLFKQVPLNTWKQYLIFHLVNDYATLLSKSFVDLHFSFYSGVLGGIDEQESREEKVVDVINEVLGELFGKTYVERYFPSDAKKRMEDLVDNLLVSYDRSIDTLTWMSDTTKSLAREKLHKITTKIGYPDKWNDYTTLEIKADDLVGNYLRYFDYLHEEDLNMVDKPVDHTKWYLNPQTVNAYYSRSSNEIVFPAAILQPPFFNKDADMAVNYGAIGSVIGHEISHGFDKNGAKYDSDGNLNDWWTQEDAQKFELLGQRLAEQYNQYEPIDGYYVNGNLTLDENMADLNGVSISYKAYKIFLNGNKSSVIDGFSGEERFFLGWSQIWRNKMKEEELLKRLLIDPHSPAKYRVLGVLTNLTSFYDTYDLNESDVMYKSQDQRITIW